MKVEQCDVKSSYAISICAIYHVTLTYQDITGCLKSYYIIR